MELITNSLLVTSLFIHFLSLTNPTVKPTSRSIAGITTGEKRGIDLAIK
jgi:hypothetical protein